MRATSIFVSYKRLYRSYHRIDKLSVKKYDGLSSPSRSATDKISVIHHATFHLPFTLLLCMLLAWLPTAAADVPYVIARTGEEVPSWLRDWCTSFCSHAAADDERAIDEDLLCEWVAYESNPRRVTFWTDGQMDPVIADFFHTFDITYSWAPPAEAKNDGTLYQLASLNLLEILTIPQMKYPKKRTLLGERQYPQTDSRARNRSFLSEHEHRPIGLSTSTKTLPFRYCSIAETVRSARSVKKSKTIMRSTADHINPSGTHAWHARTSPVMMWILVFALGFVLAPHADAMEFMK